MVGAADSRASRCDRKERTYRRTRYSRLICGYLLPVARRAPGRGLPKAGGRALVPGQRRSAAEPP